MLHWKKISVIGCDYIDNIIGKHYRSALTIDISRLIYATS